MQAQGHFVKVSLPRAWWKDLYNEQRAFHQGSALGTQWWFWGLPLLGWWLKLISEWGVRAKSCRGSSPATKIENSKIMLTLSTGRTGNMSWLSFKKNKIKKWKLIPFINQVEIYLYIFKYVSIDPSWVLTLSFHADSLTTVLAVPNSQTLVSSCTNRELFIWLKGYLITLLDRQSFRALRQKALLSASFT